MNITELTNNALKLLGLKEIKMACSCVFKQDSKCPCTSYHFQKGDIAKFGGIEGVVHLREHQYPVLLKNQETGETMEEFTADGRFLITHNEPTLILVRRAKTKTLKQVKGFVNVYEGNDVFWHQSEAGATHSAQSGGLRPIATAVPLRFTIMVEE